MISTNQSRLSRWIWTNESAPLCLQQVLGLSEPVVCGEDDLGAQRGAAQVVELGPAWGLRPGHLEWSLSDRWALCSVVRLKQTELHVILVFIRICSHKTNNFYKTDYSKS